MGPLEVKAGEYRGVRALCKIDPQTRIRRTHEIVTGKKLETDEEDVAGGMTAKILRGRGLYKVGALG